jgi:hypothetical protein
MFALRLWPPISQKAYSAGIFPDGKHARRPETSVGGTNCANFRDLEGNFRTPSPSKCTRREQCEKTRSSFPSYPAVIFRN